MKIYQALQDLVSRGAEPIPAVDVDLIKKKLEEKGLKEDGDLDVRWRVLRDKSSEDSKLVLSKAVAIFHVSSRGFTVILDLLSNYRNSRLMAASSIVYARPMIHQSLAPLFAGIV